MFLQLFLIQFTSVNINCTNGDQLTITNGDRSAIVFNYCSPVANQLSNSLLSQNTFVFISLTSKTKTNLSYYFAFYFVDNSGMTVATRTLAPVTTSNKIFEFIIFNKTFIFSATQPIIIKSKSIIELIKFFFNLNIFS